MLRTALLVLALALARASQSEAAHALVEQTMADFRPGSPLC